MQKNKKEKALPFSKKSYIFFYENIYPVLKCYVLFHAFTKCAPLSYPSMSQICKLCNFLAVWSLCPSAWECIQPATLIVTL